ncbi:MAG: hypothetical protein IT350_13370 [Deltaproteobacteria bacterium]|nr:hypothetical protein [Deltaproteobacteria bacterium]
MRAALVSVLFAVLVFASGLTGCGGDDDDSGGGSGGDDDTGDDDTGDDDAGDDDVSDDDADDDTDDDTGDDDTGTTTTTVTTTTTTTTIPDLYFDDFESYAPDAAPTSPWVIQVNGATTITVADEIAKDGEGQFLKYVAGADSGDFGNASTYINIADDAVYSFDVYRLAGASLEMRISYHDGFWLDEVIVGFAGATNKLQAWDSSVPGWLECDTVSYDEWQRVEVVYYWYMGKFDVYLDGVLTACDDVPLNHDDEQPLTLVQFLDFTSAGYGGTAYLDNVGIQSYGD